MNLDRNAQLEIQYQADPVCKEIFDTLLLAGYFRIRLPAIKVFDKALGGLAWCISCSNFNIDLPYNDDMPLRQKLKLSEIVVSALQSMKCPYILSPHQIQGLNFPSLLPVFKWLIKFVLETRDYRQDFNKNMCKFISSKIYKPAAAGVSKVGILFTEKDHRLRKNTNITKQQLRDPLRVYSSLIEFDDKTAYKTYTKLLALVAGKKVQNKRKQPARKNQVKEEDLIQQRRRISTPTKGGLQKVKTMGQVPTELIEEIEKQAKEQEYSQQQSETQSSDVSQQDSGYSGKQQFASQYASQVPTQQMRSTIQTNEKHQNDSNQQQYQQQKSMEHNQETDAVEYFEQEGYYNVFFEEEEEFEVREEHAKQGRVVQEEHYDSAQQKGSAQQYQQGYEEYNEEGVTQVREQKDVSSRVYENFNEQEEFKSFQPLQKQTSVVGKEFLQLLAENEVLAENIKELEEQAKKLAEQQQQEIAIQLQKKNELKNQEEEISRIDKQIEKMENNINEEAKKMEETLKKEEGVTKETESFEKQFEDLDHTLDQLKQQIEEEKIKDAVNFEKVDQMIIQREALRSKKSLIKADAKKKMEEFEKEKQEIEAQMPQFDDNVIKAIDNELIEKKKKYDVKYKEFANLNKEISIIQRKIENYPSAIETAQYHQRSIELFENIHKEMVQLTFLLDLFKRKNIEIFILILTTSQMSRLFWINIQISLTVSRLIISLASRIKLRK